MTSTTSGLNIKRLFLIGNLSIFMIGLGFAVRTNISSDLQADIFNHLDLANSATMLGQVLGATFIGFALTLLFGSALVDKIGMKLMLLLSAIGYIAGSIMLAMAALLPIGSYLYWFVYAACLLTGLGWGAVEAASNPMVTALYPNEKTSRLNFLHAWWPAGIVIGGLLGVLISTLGVAWQINLLILLIPSIYLAWLIKGIEFPETERVTSGVSYADMFREILKQPLFIIWFLCMMLTAATELAPQSWVNVTLSNTVGMPGIIVLVYVSLLMFLLRYFAHSLLNRFSSSLTVLWLGSLLAAIGLYFLSISNSPVTALASATIWGIGVCYMWPTMLASVSERFPRGGAFFLGLMGFAGGLSIQFVLPKMGAIFDEAKIRTAGSLEALQNLSGDALDEVIRIASTESFQAAAIIPVLLLPIFTGIWIYEKKSKLLPDQELSVRE